jgi:hypothetical protein
MDLQFPIYRKRLNNKSFYKITSPKTFEEVQLIGSRKVKYTFRADKYPEVLYIKDLIELNYSEEIAEFEWNEFVR